MHQGLRPLFRRGCPGRPYRGRPREASVFEFGSLLLCPGVKSEIVPKRSLFLYSGRTSLPRVGNVTPETRDRVDDRTLSRIVGLVSFGTRSPPFLSAGTNSTPSTRVGDGLDQRRDDVDGCPDDSQVNHRREGVGVQEGGNRHTEDVPGSLLKGKWETSK